MRVRLLAPALGLCCAMALTACGGSDEAAEARSVTPPSIGLPSLVLGLTMEPEDIDASLAQGAEQPFVDSVGLFAFREREDLLQATLQVSRFTDEARPEDGTFRGAIVSRIGGTNPRKVRVGDQELFVTTGRNQNVFIWFEEKGFFVLTVRNDYPFPRTLLRRILGLDIEL